MGSRDRTYSIKNVYEWKKYKERRSCEGRKQDSNIEGIERLQKKITGSTI